jgi:hypothetical protein
MTTFLEYIIWSKKFQITSLISIKRIIEASEAYFNNDKIKFDDNPDLLGFNNGVYDLINHEFRPYKYDDYITMTCGYDYTDKIDPIKLKELNNLIEQIMPDPDVRKLYLQILSAGLTGKAIEKFVIFNGGGRNGKGLMNEFMKLVLGDYALIYANVSILTEKDKTGPNPEKAMIHNKRFVVMKEPESSIKLKNDRVKDITGGGNISGRMCFSNQTEIKLSLMLFMECNERPRFEKHLLILNMNDYLILNIQGDFLLLKKILIMLMFLKQMLNIKPTSGKTSIKMKCYIFLSNPLNNYKTTTIILMFLFVLNKEQMII